MATHALLLRGINVGRHRQLPMAALRELLAGLGYDDVRTYVRSGNVVLGTRQKPAELRANVEKAIDARFGMAVPVIVRTRAQVTEVIDANPLPHGVAEPAKLFVAFLDAPLRAAAGDAVDPEDYLPDEFRVNGAEVYFRCPNGLANSTFTPAFWKALGVGTNSTVRNWNTLLTVQRMLDD
jgi:uncharacterized protein (DUF1697 family)